MSKKVLVVSYYFPPGGGVGSFRAAKFVKYLPEYDWIPYVVSLPPNRQSKFLPDGLDNNQYGSIQYIPEKIEYVDVTGINPSKPRGGVQWLPSLVRKLPSIIKTHDIDIVFHTGSPFLPLLCSTWINSKTNVPYVIDLRDPWYVDEALFETTKSVANPLWNWINKQSEQKVLESADRIILNSSRMEALYKQQYPEYTHAFTTITNGFDPVDYDHAAAKPFDGIRIVHPGRFRQGTDGFLNAISRVSKSNKEIEIVHFGQMNYRYTMEFYKKAEKLNIRGLFDVRGYAELETVVSVIKSADIGLVITRPDDPTHIPTKIYDYIACDIPVLALDSPDGALAQIIDPFEHAYRASHDDTERIEALLNQLIAEKPLSLGTENQRMKYTRRYLTSELVALLNNCLQ